MRYLIFTICFGIIFFITSTCAAGNFPYRGEYSEVNILELTDLKSAYDRGDLIIIDVRSKTEFEAIQIKNAINLPYADATFTRKLRNISRKDITKKIALYCNGIDCIKSYKAAEEAMHAKIPNVYAFDAGIAAWAHTYPSETLLLGKELKNPVKQFISAEKFIRKNLDFKTFKKMALSNNAVVIDARDPIQKNEELPGLEKDLDIPVDKFVRNIISKGHMKDKQLFIFDQVGRQVAWLMYYLEENGYTDYYFLSGGATSYLKIQEYRMKDYRMTSFTR
jgi:rhodanese-related sulfurtransferase